MDGTVTTVVLQGLSPLTQYLVNVYSVVGEDSSEPLKGTETTRMSSLSELLAKSFNSTFKREECKSKHKLHKDYTQHYWLI